VRPLTRPLCGHGRTGHLPLGVESLHHLLAVHGGREVVAPRPEVLGDGTVRGEEALGLLTFFAEEHARSTTP
jgi:hypothetical protein